MGGVYIFLWVVPLAVAVAAFFLFRFVSLSYGKKPLAVVGFMWISMLLYWGFQVGSDCELPPKGKSENGCGFVSSIEQIEQLSAGAAVVLSALLLIYWLVMSE